MKRFLLLAALLPAWAVAQTQERVLQLTVVRSVGSRLTATLPTSDTLSAPVLRLADGKLAINSLVIDRKRIKELRFHVETVEVADAIALPVAGSGADLPAYDLAGRPTDARAARRGIYIKGNKKYMKR